MGLPGPPHAGYHVPIFKGDPRMRTAQLPSGFHLAVVVFGLSASFMPLAASGADASKDPMGWGDVRFGMSAREVVAALGGKAQFQKAPPAAPPFMLDDRGTIDLQGALAASRRILDSEAPEGNGDLIADAARRLKKLIKPRQWILYTQGGMSGGPADATGKPLKVLHSRLFGTLESINPPGFAFGEERVSWSAVIRPVSKIKQPITWGGLFNLWDEASERYIDDVRGAVRVLSDRVSEQRRKNEPSADVEHGEVDVAAVTVRGIELQPTVTFENDKVSEIVLLTRYEGENGELFDEREMHTTLCEALEEKFGPPQERINSLTSTEAIWRFPATVITCARGRVSFPETGFVRKTVLVKYSPASNENAVSDENL